ncbi:pseudaminic acid synthase [Pseudoalteromonas sp. SMS1]|uniref:pseudaminic acid synthase n=1 Tax=Pseudoalteromonas sp. SMS1 TaxID=2908894 RepID=UPI001F19DF00|nr:pseudaminic acid synthase [Pseudoalteromonas sp. SMS1]MCF2859367.1 pseudaminic acid synthase [Pseudoalteromonas sp. SMS1]
MNIKPSLTINNTKIEEGSPCYVIAEMSANHGGSLEKAISLINVAHKAGANAIKLQTYTADTITLNCTKDDFLLPSGNAWEAHHSLYSLYQKAYTPWEWHSALFAEARRLGMDIFSSPFDTTAVDLLESLDVPAYKIASPEITDIGLLSYVAKTGKPVILSTGVAEYEDIRLAVDTLRHHGCNEIAVLKCTTAYPTPLNECNLRTIPDIAKAFDCVVGLSDHTEGTLVPVTAASVGAKIIEKHFVDSSEDDSVDAFFSLDAQAFKEMVNAVRQLESGIEPKYTQAQQQQVELALGSINYDITESAQKNILAKRSLYICKDLPAGHVLKEGDIRSVRPGFGAHPKFLPLYLGQTLKQAVELGDRVSPDLIEGEIEEC